MSYVGEKTPISDDRDSDSDSDSAARSYYL